MAFTFPNLSAGKGVLYTNQRKNKTGHPDFQGAFMTTDGRVVKISGWKKSTPKGELISLAEDNYVPQARPQKVEQQYPREIEHDENDIPF